MLQAIFRWLAAFLLTFFNPDADQDRLLASAGLKPDACFSTQACCSTYKMVEAGLGISFGQKLIFRQWHGAVRELPFDPPRYVSLGIAVPPLWDASPTTRKFIECARDFLRQSGIIAVPGGEA